MAKAMSVELGCSKARASVAKAVEEACCVGGMARGFFVEVCCAEGIASVHHCLRRCVALVACWHPSLRRCVALAACYHIGCMLALRDVLL